MRTPAMLRRSSLALPVAALATVVAARWQPGARVVEATKPAVITVTAAEYEFEAPSSVPAGAVTVRFVNNGKEIHHATLLRLTQGKTAADVQAWMAHPGPVPAWIRFMGGPNAPAPGAESTVTVALRPGHYAWICLVDGPDIPPHVMKGMFKEFDVVEGSGSLVLPPGDLTVMLSDYAFKISGPVSAGHHVFRVRNYAAQEHELGLVKLNPGKTKDDLIAWVASRQGPPPGLPLGGVAPMSQGGVNNFEVDLTPGEYLMICFAPDAKDGKPHFTHGMTKVFTVQ